MKMPQTHSRMLASRRACLLAPLACLGLDTAQAASAKGPDHDLIFAVATFSNDLPAASVSMFLRVHEGVLYGQYEKGRGNGHPYSSHWIRLYRYDHIKRVAIRLPLPTPEQMSDITGVEYRILKATETLRLNNTALSPDGYELEQPNRVNAGSIYNLIYNLGINILTLIFVGKTQIKTLSEREEYPRLTKGSDSLLMRSKEPILSESQEAYLVGWVVPSR